MDEDGRRGHTDAPSGARSVLIVDEQDEPVDHERLRHLADHVLDRCEVPADLELSVACIDAGSIAALKAEHLGEHAPTDVLAFPMDAPGDAPGAEPGILGDVVLCPEVAAAQAAERGVPAGEELELLLVHGILHLLGHDHIDATERAEMFGLTDDLLASFRGAGS